jgi:dihydrofolate reductase
VFVLTHHERAPLEMEGGTTFHFVTDGIEAALERARAAAGERHVAIAGGAATVNQYLAAGLIDELRLHVVPLLLGAGERLLEGAPKAELELLAQPRGPLSSRTCDTASFAEQDGVRVRRLPVDRRGVPIDGDRRSGRAGKAL